MGGISEVLSPDVTAQVRELLAGALDGRVVFDGRGGWKIMLFLNAKGEVELEHFQPDPDGTYKFFSYSTAGSSYGAGKILQEPDLSILPKPFDDETPIAGALVVDDSGKVVERFSWSNLKFVQHRKIALLMIDSKTWELQVSDPKTRKMVSKGYLRAMFLPDKNRMSGYVGVFAPTPGPEVKILELEDLLLKNVL